MKALHDACSQALASPRSWHFTTCHFFQIVIGGVLAFFTILRHQTDNIAFLLLRQSLQADRCSKYTRHSIVLFITYIGAMRVGNHTSHNS